MKIILFGASGMVGQGVLRECLLDADVQSVLSIGRSKTGQSHEKLREILRQDLADLADIERELLGYDACFYWLGVSSAGMTEADYQDVTTGSGEGKGNPRPSISWASRISVGRPGRATGLRFDGRRSKSGCGAHCNCKRYVRNCASGGMSRLPRPGSGCGRWCRARTWRRRFGAAVNGIACRGKSSAR
jgi:hypothetical protein